MSGKLIGDLKQTVFGWRLDPGSPVSGRYDKNRLQYEGYRTHIQQFGSHPDLAGLKSDVVSFFANVEIDRLSDQII